MSPANSANPAWLTVPPADGLPEAVAAEIGPVAEKVGFVPNVARLLAISPEHFTGWWRYFDELMRGPSGLSTTDYNVRLATATGLFPNPEYHELGRTAHKEG